MKVWINMLIYITIVYLIVSIFKVKNKNKWFLIFAGIGIIFVMGSRKHLGGVNDVEIYYNYYKYITNVPLKSIFINDPYQFEYGYILFNKLLSLISQNPQTILYAEATVCVSCVSYFIYKNSKKTFDSIIYFICLGSMMFMLSGFRQSIAMSICLISVEFIKEKKLIPFLICILLAYSFHQSAIIFLISYFIINSNFKLKHNLFLISIFMVVLLFNEQIILIANRLFNRNYSGYVGSSFNGIMYIVIYIIIILMSLITKKENNNDNKISLNMTILSSIFFVFGYFIEISQRISWYYLFGVSSALPNIYSLVSNKKSALIIRVMFLTLAIAIFVHRFSNNVYSEYIFFWE